MGKDTFFNKKKMLRCKGELITLTQPAVMGIINLSPDSFYSATVPKSFDGALFQAEKMITEGTAFLDIGAVSTRPGAKPLSPADEIKRLLPPLKKVAAAFPHIPISVDTTSSETAEAALDAGACMINDISGGSYDPLMFDIAARYSAPMVLMHIQGTPENMQQQPGYQDVVKDVMLFLSQQIEKARLKGLTDIIVDPGFGFGKTLEHNYELLAGLHHFCFFECPVMVGVSRKSMINRLLGVNPENALNGTTAVHMLALMQGADILRVHDVREAKQAIDVYLAYSKQGNE